MNPETGAVVVFNTNGAMRILFPRCRVATHSHQCKSTAGLEWHIIQCNQGIDSWRRSCCSGPKTKVVHGPPTRVWICHGRNIRKQRHIEKRRDEGCGVVAPVLITVFGIGMNIGVVGIGLSIVGGGGALRSSA